MSRSHKERHGWKEKERKRSGESDPPKIKLHRERFLARLQQSQKVVSLETRQGGRVVFSLRLLSVPDEFVTIVFRDGEELTRIEHIAVEPVDIEYALKEVLPGLDVEAETTRLADHVTMIGERGIPCHLEVSMPLGDESGDSTRLCSSCFACTFRQWDEKGNAPLCSRPD